VETLLQVKDLVTAFELDDGSVVTAVDGVSFDVGQGRTLGIVGESGCGKSVTALSIMRLLPRPAGRLVGGQVLFEGRDLTTLPVEELYAIRGGQIGMIFQEPMTALNPVHRVGRQIGEVLRLHGIKDERKIFEATLEMLKKVGIPAPESRLQEYPHQLSGGMRQRVMIAMALACRPKLLIADEPTTALDVTVQAQILELISGLQKSMNMAVILITHDLGVIAETCDEVVVMYAGRIVERAPVQDLFRNPRHAYTKGLLASIPRLETPSKTKLKVIPGSVPSLKSMPQGCRFAPRSGVEHDAASVANRPEYREITPGHWVESCPFCVEL
jgi:oligopeptide/dipeptide ABC transporter ATP-binding protein